MRPAVVFTLLSLTLAACGEKDEARVVPATPDPGHAAAVDRDPYKLTCDDLARQPEHTDNQKLVIRAEFALAQERVLAKRVEAMTLNRAGRSVYWAMTEICKGKDPSYTPGREAVEAVRQGKYLVQPRPEAWNHP